MPKFSNEDYEILAADVVHDAFYSDSSYRGKISKQRQYAEVIIRKILDIDPAATVTLGRKDIVKQIAAIPDHAFLENAIAGLKGDGDQDTHTQNLGSVTEADYRRTTDSLFDMLAYLPIRYFGRYRFGSNNEVMSAFSLLPPIIRYKVLDYLQKQEPDNISVVDKYVLILLKNFDETTAIDWIEDNKARLESPPTVSEEVKRKYIEQYGKEAAESMLEDGPQNMYEVCKGKIESLKGKNAGKQYPTFEKVLPYYKEKGILSGNTPEIKQFNDMMDFLFLGRKAENVNVEEPLTIVNILTSGLGET